MLTFSQALSILDLEGHSCVYIKDKRAHSSKKLISLKTLRDTLDLKRANVYKIYQQFSLEDGDFLGFLFITDTSIYNKFSFFQI